MSRTVSADVELNSTILRLLVRVHGHDLTLQLGSPGVDLGKARGALSVQLSEPLGPLLGNLRKPLGAPLLHLLEHTTGLCQHALHCRLQQGPHFAPHRCQCHLHGQDHPAYT
jgi:hypothetical protein